MALNWLSLFKIKTDLSQCYLYSAKLQHTIRQGSLRSAAETWQCYREYCLCWCHVSWSNTFFTLLLWTQYEVSTDAQRAHLQTQWHSRGNIWHPSEKGGSANQWGVFHFIRSLQTSSVLMLCAFMGFAASRLWTQCTCITLGILIISSSAHAILFDLGPEESAQIHK